MVILRLRLIQKAAFFYLCAALAMATSAFASPLHLVTENYPPYNYSEDGELKGLSVELMRLIMADAGLEYDMELMPWARAIALAENKNGYCVFSTVHTKERDRRFQWVEPLLISYNYLVKSADSKVQAATLDEARKHLVGTQLGDYTVGILEGLQFKRIDLASDIEVTLRKLLLGRIDLMPMGGSLVEELQQKGIPVKPLLVLTKSLNSVACNKEIPAETIAKMQASLDKLTEDGTWDSILGKHGFSRNPSELETGR